MSETTKITPEQRKALLKETSFAVGLCGSMKPERKAEVGLETVEKFRNCTL